MESRQTVEHRGLVAVFRFAVLAAGKDLWLCLLSALDDIQSIDPPLQFCLRLSLCRPGQIGSLQATQMTHEAVIRDLESEKSRLRDKVLRLEEERGALQKKCQMLDERQRQQILSLEKVRINPIQFTEYGSV